MVLKVENTVSFRDVWEFKNGYVRGREHLQLKTAPGQQILFFLRALKSIYNNHVKMIIKHDWKPTSSGLRYLASPVCVSSWFTQALYTSTGLVLMAKDLSSRISFTTGARSWRNVFCPRAPLLKLTTILMTVGFPVTMSCTWSTFDLKETQTKTNGLPLWVEL